MRREEKILEIIRLFEFYGIKPKDYKNIVTSVEKLKELENIVSPPKPRKKRVLGQKNDMRCLMGIRFCRLIPYMRIVSGVKTEYLCKCDCGNEKLVQSSHLKNGLIRSCGCLRKERMLKYNKEKKDAFEIRKQQEGYISKHRRRNKIRETKKTSDSNSIRNSTS